MRYTVVAIGLPLVAFGITAGRPSPGIAGAPGKITTVRADEIGKKVQIIGRVGKPMGTVMTVRGAWHRRVGAAKPGVGLEFHVTEVNDHRLPEPVVFLPELIHVRQPQNVKPEEGAVWELRAIETGQFRNSEAIRWTELYGSPPISPPDWGQDGPFVSELTGIIKDVRRGPRDAKSLGDTGANAEPR